MANRKTETEVATVSSATIKTKRPGLGGRVLHSNQTLTDLNNSTNDDTANNGDASEDGRNTRIRKDPNSKPMGSNRNRKGSNPDRNSSPVHSTREQESRC